MTLSLLGVSLPTFLIGILLILVFAVLARLVPQLRPRRDGAARLVDHAACSRRDGWSHIVLPAVTLAIFQLTLIMRLVRAEMLEVLRTDYIKFARARGLSDRAIHFGHALKNTLVPVMTITGLQLGGADRLRDHHRDGVPVARHGPAVHPGRDLRRHPGHGGLPVPDRPDLRRRSTSSSTCCISRSIRGCAWAAPEDIDAGHSRQRGSGQWPGVRAHRALPSRAHRVPARPARASRTRASRRSTPPARVQEALQRLRRRRDPHRHRQDRRGRRDPRPRHGQRPHDRPARRHGRAADARGQRLRLALGQARA